MSATVHALQEFSKNNIHVYSGLSSCYFESLSGLMSDCSLIVNLFLKTIE